MEYNKRQFKKNDNKKLLHKIKKHWIVISVAMLAAIGGSTVATHKTHADVNLNHSNSVNSINNSSTNLSTSTSDHHFSVNHNYNDQRPGDNLQNNSQNIVSQARDLHRKMLLSAPSFKANNQINNNQKDAMQPVTSFHVSSKPVKLTGDQLSNNDTIPKDSGTTGLENPGIHTPGILIKYVDASDGNRVINSDSEPYPAGKKYVLSNKLDAIKQGYHYTGIKDINKIPKDLWIDPNDTYRNVPKYIKAPENNLWLIIDVDVAKDSPTTDGIIIVTYEKENGQQIFQFPMHGVSGKEIPVNDLNGNGFKSSIPSGYYFKSLAPNETWPSTYPSSENSPQTIHIIVTKNTNYHPKNIIKNGLINIDYIDNNHLVNQDVLSDEIGDFFNIHPYEAQDQIPQGYHYLNVLNNQVPEKYSTVPQTVYINVASDSNKPIEQKGSINVAYNDVTNGDNRPIAVDRLSNGVGTSFDINPYEDQNNIPNGYIWNGKITGQVPHQYMSNVQTVTIDLINTQSFRQGHVEYLENLGQGITKRIKIYPVTATNSDTPINYGQMENDLHQMGYEVIPSDPADHVDEDVQNHGTSIIYVKKIPHPTSKEGYATIIYQDVDNHNAQIGSPEVVNGRIGQNVNYEHYITVNGKHYQYNGNNNVAKYTATPQTIHVLMKPTSVSNNTSTITIDYRFGKGKMAREISSMIVNGTPGEPFTINDYISNYNNPNQDDYVFEGLSNGNDVHTFTKGNQTVVAQLRHNPVDSIAIIYHSVSDGNDQGSINISGHAMDKINYTPYITSNSKGGKLPQGYTFAGYESPGGTYFGDGKNVIINIRKVVNPSNSGSSKASGSANKPSSSSSQPSSASKPASSGSVSPSNSGSSKASGSANKPSSSSSQPSSASKPASSGSVSPSNSRSSKTSGSTNKPSSSSSQPSSASKPANSGSVSPSNSGSSKASGSTNKPSSSSSQPSSASKPASSGSVSPSNSGSSKASGSANKPSSSSSQPSSASKPASSGSVSPSNSGSSKASGSTNKPSSSSSQPSSASKPASSGSVSPSNSGSSKASGSANKPSSSSSQPSSAFKPASSGSVSPSNSGSSKASGSTNKPSSSSSQPSSASKPASSGSVSPSNSGSSKASGSANKPSSSSSQPSSISNSSQAPINIINVPYSNGNNDINSADPSNNNQSDTRLNYVDAHGNPIAHKTIMGTNTNINQYTNNAPSGYRINRILGTGDLANGNRVITIQLSPNKVNHRTTKPVTSAKFSHRTRNPNVPSNHSDPIQNNTFSHNQGINGTVDDTKNYNNSPMLMTLKNKNHIINNDNSLLKPELPQTGETSNNYTRLGMIMASVSILIAILGRDIDRRRKD